MLCEGEKFKITVPNLYNIFFQYNEVESAINCRKLIHGKKWPSSNPKKLRVMYSSQVMQFSDAKKINIDKTIHKISL